MIELILVRHNSQNFSWVVVNAITKGLYTWMLTIVSLIKRFYQGGDIASRNVLDMAMSVSP